MSSFKEPTKHIGNVAELFAGVGGFRIGLARAGWRTTTYYRTVGPTLKAVHYTQLISFGK